MLQNKEVTRVFANMKDLHEYVEKEKENASTVVQMFVTTVDNGVQLRMISEKQIKGSMELFMMGIILIVIVFALKLSI